MNSPAMKNLRLAKAGNRIYFIFIETPLQTLKFGVTVNAQRGDVTSHGPKGRVATRAF